MPEKIKKPRTERVPESPEPPSDEQEILVTLHAEAERHHSGHASSETLGKLHQDIERCNCYPMFKQYTSGEIPTLDRMFSNVKAIVAEMDREIDVERTLVANGEKPDHLQHLERCRGLLLGRETQIRGGVQRYVHSVIRFNRLRKLQTGPKGRLVDGDWGTQEKQYEQADHARRRAHNSLIDSLVLYQSMISALREEGLASVYKNFNFHDWNLGTDARKVPSDHTILFDKDAATQRDFIRDWAIVADFHEQLRELGDDEWLKTKEAATK